MTDEADEAPRDTHLPSPMEAKEFPGQVRFPTLFILTLNQKNLTTGRRRASNATHCELKHISGEYFNHGIGCDELFDSKID